MQQAEEAGSFSFVPPGAEEQEETQPALKDMVMAASEPVVCICLIYMKISCIPVYTTHCDFLICSIVSYDYK